MTISFRPRAALKYTTAISAAVLTLAAPHFSEASDAAAWSLDKRDCGRGLRLYPSEIQLIDPELRPFLSILTAMDSQPQGEVNMAETRAKLKALQNAAPLTLGVRDGVASEERWISGSQGHPPVRVLVYSPQVKGALAPALLEIHGGAFVLGAADGGDATNRRLAKDLGVVVVSVDYRLAPEDPFPAAIEDSYAALKWIHTNASQLGVDRKKIGVMGSSAGGGLAASLALLARDRGEFPVRGQFLIYPSLDDRPFSSADPTCLPGTAVPSERAYQMYLGGLDNLRQVSPYAFAARASSLAGLPRAFIAVGSIDGLADQDLAFASRLIRAGVATEVKVYPGAFHGFDMAAQAAVTERFNADLRDAIRAALQ